MTPQVASRQNFFQRDFLESLCIFQGAVCVRLKYLCSSKRSCRQDFICYLKMSVAFPWCVDQKVRFLVDLDSHLDLLRLERTTKQRGTQRFVSGLSLAGALLTRCSWAGAAVLASQIKGESKLRFLPLQS